MFNVTLEKFDATAKPKIIKEIKNLIPNMNLMEVRYRSFATAVLCSTLTDLFRYQCHFCLPSCMCMNTNHQAKKFAESVPKVLKENIPKEDAEKLQKTLEALGATVTLS